MNLQELYKSTGLASAMSFGSSFGGNYEVILKEVFFQTIKDSIYITFRLDLHQIGKQYEITEYFSKVGENPDTQKSQAWMMLSSFQYFNGGNFVISEKMTKIRKWDDISKEYVEANEILQHIVSIEGKKYFMVMKSKMTYPKIKIDGAQMRELSDVERTLPKEPCHVYIPNYNAEQQWNIKVLAVLNEHKQQPKEHLEGTAGVAYKKFNTAAWHEEKQSLEQIEGFIIKKVTKQYEEAGLPVPKIRPIVGSAIADFFESNPLMVDSDLEIPV